MMRFAVFSLGEFPHFAEMRFSFRQTAWCGDNKQNIFEPHSAPSVFVHLLQDLPIELLPVRQIMFFYGLITKKRVFA